MPKPKKRDASEIICAAEWPVSKTEILRIVLRKYKGHLLADIRRWFLNVDGGWQAGRGASLPAEDVQRVRKALKKILRKLSAMGVKCR